MREPKRLAILSSLVDGNDAVAEQGERKMENVIIVATHESGNSITLRRVPAEAARTISLLRQSSYIKIDWKREGDL